MGLTFYGKIYVGYLKCSGENPKLLGLFALFGPVLTRAYLASDMWENGVRITSPSKLLWITGQAQDGICSSFHVWYSSVVGHLL